jgi:hypothetical protein
VKDEPYHPSSSVEFVLLVVKLVILVMLVSVVKLVFVVKLLFVVTLFGVTLFGVDEAVALELLRVVIGVELAVATLASGDAGAPGEAIPTPLSTL